MCKKLGIRMCVEGPVVKNDKCVAITEFGQYHRDALGKKQMFAPPAAAPSEPAKKTPKKKK